MDIPQLPTDCLYKFVALAGIALVALSVAYPPLKMQEVQLLNVAAAAELQKMKLEAADLQRELDKLNKKEAITAEDAQNVRRHFNEIRLHDVEMMRQSRIADIGLDWLIYYHRLGIAGFILGLVLANTGFLLWYRRVQQPADAVMKREAERTSEE